MIASIFIVLNIVSSFVLCNAYTLNDVNEGDKINITNNFRGKQ